MEKTNSTLRVFTITENGFSMQDHKVSVPHCKIKAHSYMEAAQILGKFLETRMCPPEMELITPFERIQFDMPKP